jgi:hypothetical protein
MNSIRLIFKFRLDRILQISVKYTEFVNLASANSSRMLVALQPVLAKILYGNFSDWAQLQILYDERGHVPYWPQGNLTDAGI